MPVVSSVGWATKKLEQISGAEILFLWCVLLGYFYCRRTLSGVGKSTTNLIYIEILVPAMCGNLCIHVHQCHHQCYWKKSDCKHEKKYKLVFLLWVRHDSCKWINSNWGFMEFCPCHLDIFEIMQGWCKFIIYIGSPVWIHWEPALCSMSLLHKDLNKAAVAGNGLNKR